MTPVFLVGCALRKADLPCAAHDLYTSQLFRLSRAYVEALGARWFILSAKYGLVAPEREIAPYDLSLKRLTAAETYAWGMRVRDQLAAAGLDAERGSDRFTFLAGLAYREAVGLPRRCVTAPLAGLAIGQQMARLKLWTAQVRAERAC